MAQKALLDHFGTPMRPSIASSERVANHLLQREVGRLKGELKASYDAATLHNDAFDEYWRNTDYLSPDSANLFAIRRRLRSRSRYEVIENNPYLKGTILTLVNDFVSSGPRPRIVDDRIPLADRRPIERQYARWAKATKYRQKLWRMRLAKCVDGESFKIAFTNRHPKFRHVNRLDWNVYEADQCTSLGIIQPNKAVKEMYQMEIDGIRVNKDRQPLDYFFLNNHPGSLFTPLTYNGNWINAKYVSHWFRQDRGWHRGIPETTVSLPLCALLRRYTHAVVKAAETGASLAAVLESEAPPGTMAWTDGAGHQVEDDPFDVFPIQQGMFVNLPWGYKLKQLAAEQPTTTYDAFTACLLREITRPLLSPYNISAGTSKDSNMSSAVVDAHIYRSGIDLERMHCEEEVLNDDFYLWWENGLIIPGYLPNSAMDAFFDLDEPPEVEWQWDKVGVEHTDPEKVMNALALAHEKGFITDRDIQEHHYNRNVEDWEDDMRSEMKFREEIGLPIAPPMKDPNEPPPGANGKPPAGKPKKVKASARKRVNGVNRISNILAGANGHH